MNEAPADLTPTAVIAERVREVRRRHGWSQQQLADEMTRVGVSWERMVVTKLEAGKRQNVTVVELFALAYVLSVAPINLVIPTTDDGRFYAVTPEELTPAIEAREWIRGGSSMYGQDPRVYFSEVPASEWDPPKMTQRQIDTESDTLRKKRDRKG